MVERQSDIDPVAGSGLTRRDEGSQHALRPRLRQSRGFRQARRAGRVDIEAQVCAAQFFAMLTTWPFGGYRSHCRHQILAFLAAIGPNFRLTFKQTRGATDRFILVSASNDQFGVGNIHAMRERFIGEVMIDKADNDADLGQSIPGGDIFRAVLHKQGNSIARLQTERQPPIGKLIGEGIHFRIGREIAFKPPSNIVRVFVDHVFKIVGDQLLGVR